MSTTINHKHIVWSDRDDTLCNILVTFRLLDNVVCEIGSVIRSETRFVSGVSFKKPNKMDKGWSLKSHLNLEAQEKVNCAQRHQLPFSRTRVSDLSLRGYSESPYYHVNSLSKFKVKFCSL